MLAAPDISVVIPTYNRKALTVEAVRSVLAQTHEDFEVIVVDDGSTDGTQEAIQEAFGDEPRLRYVRKENGGTASARNRGTREARGRLIAFLDSDDLWLPRFLESQRAVIDAEDAGMVMCDVQYEGHDDRKSDHLFGDPDFRAPTSPESMFQGAWGLPTAQMLRMDIAKALPFREDYYHEDTELLFRFYGAGHRCVLNEERLAIWRHHGGGDAADRKSDHATEFESEHLRMLEENRGWAPNWHRLAKRMYFRHRELAKKLVQAGRFREARPHLKVWWRRRPFRWRPAWLLLRSYLPGNTP